MAEDKSTLEAELAGIGDEEEDTLFKVQMAVANAFLGYWKHGLGVCIVILTVTFGYGSWTSHVRETQREYQAQLAKIDLKMPEPSPMFMAGLGPMDDPEDSDRMAELGEGARRYEEVGKNANGTGAVMAYLRAAEVWDRAGQNDKAVAARIAAGDISGDGVIGWAAASGKAYALASGGDVDGAAAVLRMVADSDATYIGQQALYDLGQVYAAAGRTQEAKAAYQELSTKYPESKLAGRATLASTQLGESG